MSGSVDDLSRFVPAGQWALCRTDAEKEDAVMAAWFAAHNRGDAMTDQNSTTTEDPLRAEVRAYDEGRRDSLIFILAAIRDRAGSLTAVDIEDILVNHLRNLPR
jgi:hypothetical protein